MGGNRIHLDAARFRVDSGVDPAGSHPGFNVRHRLSCTARLPVPLIVIACALLAACGGPRLVAETPPGVNLAGTWRIDRSASDDPQALIQQLDAAVQRRGRRPPAGEESVMERAFRGPSLSRRYGQALGASLSVESLTIEQSPDRLVISRDGSRRTYTPGGQSVVSVAEGVADQRTGWKGREFVIDVSPQVGPSLTERFGLSADGKLVERVSVSERGWPKLEFTRVYEAGPPPTRMLPTSH